MALEPRAARPGFSNKGTQVGKEDIKLYLFTNEIIMYAENTKTLTKKKKTPGINSDYSKTAG